MLAQSDIVPRIPLDSWVENAVDFSTENFSGFFGFLETVIGFFVDTFETGLTLLPPLVMVVIFAALAWYLTTWRLGLLTGIGFLLMISLGVWDEAMLTLALVLSSTAVAVVIGIPVGILSAQSGAVETVVRPILDLMQTLPAFVYLVPAIIFLGIGNAPGLVATVIFATPPGVRLTTLGIQQVSKETVEAAHAFGASRWQTLFKVELPQALPTIMAGINQVIMLALSMVVIASLIGAGGLGGVVLTGLGQLDVGRAFVGGIGIVIIAIILDRITRNVAGRERKGFIKST